MGLKVHRGPQPRDLGDDDLDRLAKELRDPSRLTGLAESGWISRQPRETPGCEHFSRNSLVFEFTRLVRESMPKTFVMENVPAMASMVTEDGVPLVDAIALDLERGGWAPSACRPDRTAWHPAFSPR